MKSVIITLTLAVVTLLAASHVGPPSAYPVAITGEADPAVTQATIAKTICKDHYTATVRAVTEAEKNTVLARDHQTKRGCCEVDHFISLELGGTNSVKNLWAQPYSGQYGARVKDVVETALHRHVCDKEDPMPLTVAQNCIIKDWVACGRRIGVIK